MPAPNICSAIPSGSNLRIERRFFGRGAGGREKRAFFILKATAGLVFLSSFFLIGFIVLNGLSAMSIEFLTSPPTNRMTEGGIFPAIVGTVCLIIGSLAASTPLGVMTAVYLTEYAGPSKATKAIEMAINNLAGTPSVVFGLFGLALFVKYFNFGPSLLSSSLTLGLMILPVIIRSSQEALSSVPKEYREASFSLGVSKWKTIFKVVLPSAVPGIMTGIILSVGRAAGETAPILLTGVSYFQSSLPESVFSRFMALPYHLFVLATSGLNIEATRPLQYGTALVLLGVVLAVNLIAIFLRTHYTKKKAQ